MTIKHLVISGGGPNGFTYLGALQYLHDNGVWNINDINTIYATSVGAMIAVFLALKYDWETLNNYLINRPWKDVFKIRPKHILDSFSLKGLFNEDQYKQGFKPLLEAKNLDINITLKEFYEYSHIDLHFFCVEINSFELIDINYQSFPDIELTKAILMTSSIPSIIQPYITDNKCYVDGGLKTNYPVDQCVKDNCNIDEILGIRLENIDGEKSFINEDSNLLEYMVQLLVNYIYHYSKNNTNSVILKNELVCTGELLTLDFLKQSINEASFRKTLLEKGYEIGRKYLETLEDTV